MARSAPPPWTNASIAGILARHACPARCGARRRAQPPSLGSAPCLPLDTGKLLPRSLRPRQPASRRQPAVKSADPGQPPKSSAAEFNAPGLRGFRPPSTSSVVVIVIFYPNLRGCLDGLLEYTRQMAVLRARARQISMITPMLSRGTVKSVVRNLWRPIWVRPGFAGGAADWHRTSRRASLRRRPRLLFQRHCTRRSRLIEVNSHSAG